MTHPAYLAFRLGTVVAAMAFLAACAGVEKTSNPLSPSVAGPIAGVTITAPSMLIPSQGSRVEFDKQPITLSLENAVTSGVRPLSYTFELSADAAFQNLLFQRAKVTPGEGRTVVQLPDPLASGRTYYWRAKAEDGANTGPFSNVVTFSVYTPVTIGKAVAASPTGTIGTVSPDFAIGNAPHSAPVGAISYTVEIATNEAFTDIVAVWSVQEQANQTTLRAPSALAYKTTYYWRTRGAVDPNTLGAWSDAKAFTTPAPPSSEGGGGSAADQLNLGLVSFLHRNVSNWTVTSSVTGVRITRDTVCVDHTAAGQFPQSPFGDIMVEGNVWIFAVINGRWYGATWDWLRPGQTCKSVTAPEFGADQIRMSPMDSSWVPRGGDTVGFMVSTRARDDVSAGQERSNVVLVTWPN